MLAKLTGHPMEVKDVPPTKMPTERIRHQMKLTTAAAAVPSPIGTHPQKRKKIASPVFVKQAYAVPKYKKFKLPNGQESINLTDMYNYYQLKGM